MSQEKHGHFYKDSIGGYFRMFPIPGTRFKSQVLVDLAVGMAYFNIKKSDESKVSPGLTYLGQFIDHDITRMQRSVEIPKDGPVNVAELVQERSSALDLDSLYGDGLTDGVVRFTSDGKFFSEHICQNSELIYDLPRGLGDKGFLARIGDSRNDENLLIAQMHVLFMNFHNVLMDYFSRHNTTISIDVLDFPKNISDEVRRNFTQARHILTLIYQRIIIDDFLSTLLNQRVFSYLFPKDNSEPEFTILNAITGEEPRIPIEFSGAAFRFGHAMVRNSYKLNSSFSGVGFKRLFSLTGPGGLSDPFGTGEEGLDLKDFAIDWKEFFIEPGDDRPVQTAFSIKPLLIDEMRELINEMPGNRDLAMRNLLRGKELDLPSAQEVIQYINERHHDYYEKVGLVDAPSPNDLMNAEVEYGKIMAEFGVQKRTPLWLYILLEPYFYDAKNQRLGGLGSIILGETFRMLLTTSKISVFKDDQDEMYKILSDLSGEEKDFAESGVRMLDMVNIVQNQPQK